MNKISVSLLLAAVAILPGSVRAQGSCPDLGTVTAPATTTYGPMSPCGIGLDLWLGGVHYTVKQGLCPAWSAFTPERGVPAVARKGYFYQQAAPTFTLVQNYLCSGWFWTNCVVNGNPTKAGPVPNYGDVVCAVRTAN